MLKTDAAFFKEKNILPRKRNKRTRGTQALDKQIRLRLMEENPKKEKISCRGLAIVSKQEKKKK